MLSQHPQKFAKPTPACQSSVRCASYENFTTQKAIEPLGKKTGRASGAASKINANLLTFSTPTWSRCVHVGANCWPTPARLNAFWWRVQNAREILPSRPCGLCVLPSILRSEVERSNGNVFDA